MWPVPRNAQDRAILHRRPPGQFHSVPWLYKHTTEAPGPIEGLVQVHSASPASPQHSPAVTGCASSQTCECCNDWTEESRKSSSLRMDAKQHKMSRRARLASSWMESPGQFSLTVDLTGHSLCSNHRNRHLSYRTVRSLRVEISFIQLCILLKDRENICSPWKLTSQCWEDVEKDKLNHLEGIIALKGIWKGCLSAIQWKI